jgi:hypothetical protein
MFKNGLSWFCTPPIDGRHSENPKEKSPTDKLLSDNRKGKISPTSACT